MGLQANIENEAVEKLEIREVQTVAPDAKLREAVALMRSNNVGCVVVVDQERKPVGMFTESMLTELLAHQRLDLDAKVEDCMSDRCPWVNTDDRISDVIDAMQLKNVRMLAVLDNDGRVIGLTGQRGVMEYIADHFPGQVMVQRVGQTPFLSNREGA